MKYLVLFILSIYSFGAVGQDSEYHLDETFKINSSGTIDLRSDDANVYITGSNRDDVHLKVERIVDVTGFSWGDIEFDMAINEKNGNLEIREEKEGSVNVIGSIYKKYNIWIEAPYSVSLKIRGDDDDYEIKNINGTISMKVDDGDIDLKNCKGKEFIFDLDDGDVVADHLSGSLKIDGDDSDITIKNADLTSSEVNLDDGNLKLTTSLHSAGDYRFDGDDADFDITITKGGGMFTIRHDDGRTRSSGDFEVLEDRDGKSVLKLRDGSAKVNFYTDDAGIYLTTN